MLREISENGTFWALRLQNAHRINHTSRILIASSIPDCTHFQKSLTADSSYRPAHRNLIKFCNILTNTDTIRFGHFDQGFGFGVLLLPYEKMSAKFLGRDRSASVDNLRPLPLSKIASRVE